MRAKNRENLLWPLLVQGWVNSVPFLKVAGRRNNIMGETFLLGTLQGMLVESIGLRRLLSPYDQGQGEEWLRARSRADEEAASGKQVPC